MKTFIITYNPAKWPESKIQELINNLDNGVQVIERWKFGSPKKCQIGDRIFLSRVGAKKPGLIGSGHIASLPRQEQDFANKEKLSWYVDIEFDFLSSTPDTVIISHEKLAKKIKINKRVFTPQQSGVSFKGDQVLLESIWNSYIGKPNSSEDKKLQLIESLNAVMINAEEFNQLTIDSSSETLRRFSQFFHWYYFPNLNIFAPSKFIGYKNTTISNYLGKGTGTDTQKVLAKWFTKVNENSPKYESLKEKIEIYGQSLNKKIGKKTFHGTGGIYLLSEKFIISDYPDEIEDIEHFEGAAKRVTVNAYERNLKARSKCISHYGAVCSICGFDFSRVYGNELGKGFIHVHHLVDIASIGKEYKVDPIKDLLPLCPNCHAMVHKRKPAILPNELRKMIAKKS